jgi:hypothetical protein
MTEPEKDHVTTTTTSGDLNETRTKLTKLCQNIRIYYRLNEVFRGF